MPERTFVDSASSELPPQLLWEYHPPLDPKNSAAFSCRWTAYGYSEIGLPLVTPKQLQATIKKVLRGSRTEVLAYLAILCGSLAVALSKEKCSSPLCSIAFWVLAVAASTSFVSLVFLHARSIIGGQKRRNAPFPARGLYPFLEADANLFQGLGRNSDIRLLGGMLLDTQLSVIALYGEPGAGKTSLLRAGLEPWLKLMKEPKVTPVYCNVAGPDPVGALSRAVLTELKEDVGRALNSLAKMDTRAILIIDSFEAIQPDSLEHAPFIELLSNLKQAPHVVQVLVAFQDYYLPIWRRIEQQIGMRSALLRLALLHPESAGKAIENILEDADVAVERSIIRDYIRSVASNNGVSPMDVAIGSHVFEQWARQRPGRFLRFVDYANAGGAQGVMMAHVRECLRTACASEADCIALTRGLVEHLADNATNKRNLTGVSAAEFAANTGLSFEALSKLYLPRLAGPDARVLEALPGESPVRYRLARDSVALVLGWLKQNNGAPDKLANLFLRDRMLWWQRTQSQRDLLHGKLLKLARSQRKVSHSAGANDMMFDDYLKKSTRAQSWSHSLKGSGAVAAVAVSSVLVVFASAFIKETQLKSWRLPGELYVRQDRIKSLRIQGYAVTELGWLQPVSFRDLEILDSRLASLAGITKLRSVENLTLDLNGAPVTSLAEVAKIPGLTTLKTYLGSSGVHDFGDLAQATQLRELSLGLGGSSIKSVAPLSQMSQIETLRLQLAGSAIRDLADVPKMNGLRSLTLDLDATQLGLIADITSAVNLHDLTINVENPRGHRKAVDAQNLPSLAGLEGLRNLTLNLVAPPADLTNPTPELDQPPVRDLSTLVLPEGLQELTLDLGGFPMERLPELGRLDHLQRLGLHLCGSRIHYLPDMRHLRELHKLDLCLAAPQGGNPRLAGLNLDELLLEIRGSNLSIAPKLAGLRGLRKLTLNVWQTSISHFSDLSALRDVRDLELHLKWDQVAAIPSLATLKDLEILRVHFIGAPAPDLPPLGIQHHLSDLTLNLSGTALARMPDIGQFGGIKRLLLDLSDSKMQNLDGLLKVGTLENLAIVLSNARMMRHLPDLAQLKGLTYVTLILDGSEVQDIPDIGALTHLKGAMVSLRNSQIASLAETRHLGALQEVTLDQHISSLRDLPASVERIAFCWGQ